MPPLIRPEAAATLHRLREALAGLALAGLGLWVLPGPGYLLPAVGSVLVLLGAGLAVIGLRRYRFRATGEGPGLVQVVEGQIAYFGPADAEGESGGFMALDDVAALTITADGRRWHLIATDGTELHIPRAARGAEDLLDAFVRLPGLDPAAVVRAASGPGTGQERRLWQRGPRPPALPRD